MTNEELLRLAERAALNSYSPYSHFRVGAALECADGTIFTGCNVENAAYGCSICGERTAMVKAVSEGHRDFVRLAVTSPDSRDWAMPCGECRQFMAEFNLDMDVIVGRQDGQYIIYKVRELLPYSFNAQNVLDQQV